VHAEQRGGVRDRVPVIAARVRHHTVFPGRVETGGDRGVRAPQLERADWLERLRLDQQLRRGARKRHKRCAYRHSGETARGVLDLRQRDKISHLSIVPTGMTHRDERPDIVTDRKQALSRTAYCCTIRRPNFQKSRQKVLVERQTRGNLTGGSGDTVGGD